MNALLGYAQAKSLRQEKRLNHTLVESHVLSACLGSPTHCFPFPPIVHNISNSAGSDVLTPLLRIVSSNRMIGTVILFPKLHNLEFLAGGKFYVLLLAHTVDMPKRTR